MEQIRPGMLAYSLAGHDKDTLYFIVRADDRFVWLSDGRLKTVDAPKRKNLQHVQVIKSGMECAPEKLTNEAVKRIIKLYIMKRPNGHNGIPSGIS